MRKIIASVDIIRLTGILPLLFSLSVSAVNITFDGELLDRPCQIDSGSLNQTLQFKERPVKDFQYNPGRGPAEKFSIQLIDCDINSVWKIVKLKFSGNHEPRMKEFSDYFLSVTGENHGMLAVGLLDIDGTTALKLGEVHNKKQGTQIDGNRITLTFSAFVQATPDAITHKSVQPGEYTSVANFELFYE
ncbi:fimbrial subunit [Citrobacter freundii]|nr:fimbrial subunit [Citrobacter freundii]